MADHAAERVLTGVSASKGRALGPCYRDLPCESDREPGLPEDEAEALVAAVKAAADELAGLMGAEDDLAADILEFQAALLDDEELTGPVFERIAKGEAAHTAWQAVFDGEIGDYASTDDDYMAARADDLRDLKQRVLRHLYGDRRAVRVPPLGGILVSDDFTPSAFLESDWSRLSGAALGHGSATSHVAILARARGIPMAVGLGELALIEEGDLLALDGNEGLLMLAPSETTRARFAAGIEADTKLQDRARLAAREPAVTQSGRAITVLINVDDPTLLDGIDPATCDGIGLTRTEFLFGHGAPDEDEQAQVYERIVTWADGRPVTIRTLDAGGDKPIPGITIDGEANPFLGVRGLRLSLLNPDLFRVQLRAIARAARFGPVKVMVPMVTVPSELKAARAQLDLAMSELAARDQPHARPALGIMVETPAAALTAETWDADFYSIGSNDLIQYATACARDNPRLAALADPMNPAVLELIGRTVAAGRARGVEVSLCGDMASGPETVPVLLDLGLDTLSVAPAQLGLVKLAINKSSGLPAHGD